MNKQVKKYLVLVTALVTVLGLIFNSSYFVYAQQLESSSYIIQGPNYVGVAGTDDSGSYSLFTSFGDTTADARLTSASYSLSTGDPAVFIANVPLIKCFETNTDDSLGGSTDTACNGYPLTASTGGEDLISGDGLRGICGEPGCYDRAKVEIDNQGNPIDTLYLVSVFNNTTNTQYYLQSDNTIDLTYDINDYQTICEIEGLDERTGSGCVTSTDPDWNETLQSYNILNLTPGHNYSVSVKALSGDLTETRFSTSVSATLEYSSLTFDIDIADSGGSSTETEAPYNILLGDISNTLVTSTDRIWLDSGTNFFNGFSILVETTGLSNGTNTIPSTSEDLDVDSGGDGGFGLKIISFTQNSLGPLLASATYNTTTTNEVGAVGSATTIFSTNSTGSNQGPVSGARSSVEVKAKTVSSTPPGSYIAELIFTMIANP